MTTHTLAQGTRSSAVLALGTLAAGTYVCSSAIDLGAAIPPDVTFEVEANPNGSMLNIAGICNKKRNVLGMMPHPERCSEAILGGIDGKFILDSIKRS